MSRASEAFIIITQVLLVKKKSDVGAVHIFFAFSYDGRINLKVKSK